MLQQNYFFTAHHYVFSEHHKPCVITQESLFKPQHVCVATQTCGFRTQVYCVMTQYTCVKSKICCVATLFKFHTLIVEIFGYAKSGVLRYVLKRFFNPFKVLWEIAERDIYNGRKQDPKEGKFRRNSTTLICETPLMLTDISWSKRLKLL